MLYLGKNTQTNDMLTLNKETCLVEIRVVSETDINNWKKSEKNLVNKINSQIDKEFPPIKKSIS